MCPKHRIIKTYVLLIAFAAVLWLLAFIIWSHHILSFSLCLLAFGFGMRHGIDADHIAAIDNVTRKLINSDNPPIAVGFFFSLGHSLVVILLTLFIILMAEKSAKIFPIIGNFGAIFGGIFAGFFLLLFAAINGYLFFITLRKHRQSSTQKDCRPQGPLSTIFKPALKIVSKSWHMLLVGFLFGLGFDTATEVAVLGMSGHQVMQHTSLWAIMIFPALFTAGMCLVDTSSGLLMVGACRWANINPKRNLYYNLTITALSFLTALIIGGYEILNILAARLNWHLINSYFALVDNHFTLLGFSIIAIFLLAWSLRSLIRERS